MPQKWSKEIVVRHILKRRRGKQKLNSGYMQVNCAPLYLAGCNYFGSWRKAIEAAGLKYDDVRILEPVCRVWNKKKLIATIRKRYRSKQPLNSNHIQTKEVSLYGGAYKHFGGWAQAIAAAGLDYSKLRRKAPMRSWSKAAIIEEVIRRSEVGLSIRGGDVYEEDEGLYQAAKRHFGKGGWAKARVLAGFDPIDPRPWKIWDRRKVCDEIIRLHESGVALNTGALYESSYRYIHSAGRLLFGSWAKAIRASGLDYSKIKKNRQKGWWTKPRILMCIRSLERRGIRLNHNNVRKKHCALLGTAIHYFGSWSQAVEAAGISYRRHALTWSTKAWLRGMQEGEYQRTLEKAQVNAKKRRSAK